MKDLLAMSDMVVSRAGANAIFEFLALKKPNLLIPLPAASSRGDQIQGFFMKMTLLLSHFSNPLNTYSTTETLT